MKRKYTILQIKLNLRSKSFNIRAVTGDEWRETGNIRSLKLKTVTVK